MKKSLLLLFVLVLSLNALKAQTSVLFKLTCNNGIKKVPDMFIEIDNVNQSVDLNGETTFSLNPGTYQYEIHYGDTETQTHARTGDIIVNGQPTQEVSIDLGYETTMIVKDAQNQPMEGVVYIGLAASSGGLGGESTNWVKLAGGQKTFYLRNETYIYMIEGKVGGSPVPTYYSSADAPIVVAGSEQTVNVQFPQLYRVEVSITNIPNGISYLTGTISVNNTDGAAITFGATNVTVFSNQISNNQTTMVYYAPTGANGFTLVSDFPTRHYPLEVNQADVNENIALPHMSQVTFTSTSNDYINLKIKGTLYSFVCPPAGEGSSSFLLEDGTYTVGMEGNDDYNRTFTVPAELNINLTLPFINVLRFDVKNTKGEDIWYRIIHIEKNGVFVTGAEPKKPQTNNASAQGKGMSTTKVVAGTYTYRVIADGLIDKTGTLTVADSNDTLRTYVEYDTDKVVGKVRNAEGQGVYGSLVIYPVSVDQLTGKKTLLSNNIRLVFLEQDGSFKEELEIGEYYFQAKGELLGYLNAYYKKGSKPSPLSWEDAELVSVSYEDSINIYLAKEGTITSGSVSFKGTVKEGQIKSTMARPVAYATVILYGKSKSKAFAENDYEPLLKTEVDETGNFSFGKKLTQEYFYRIRVELATYVMESDFEIDPAADGATVYNIDFLVDDAKQLIAGNYTHSQGESTGAATTDSRSITLYPNPATDVLHIKTNTTGTYTVKIYNALGQAIISTNSTLPEITIDVNKLRSGIYFVKIETNGKTQIIKLMKD